jgi:hypothetical protein
MKYFTFHVAIYIGFNSIQPSERLFITFRSWKEECFLTCAVPWPEETHIQCLKASHVIELWNRVQADFESGDVDPWLGSCGGKALGLGPMTQNSRLKTTLWFDDYGRGPTLDVL